MSGKTGERMSGREWVAGRTRTWGPVVSAVCPDALFALVEFLGASLEVALSAGEVLVLLGRVVEGVRVEGVRGCERVVRHCAGQVGVGPVGILGF